MGKGRNAGGTQDPKMWRRHRRDNDSVRSRRYSLLVCDYTVIASILFLIFFTPLAFGSVHPWAFSLMEGVIFLLVAVWMSKLLIAFKSQGLAVGGHGDTGIRRSEDSLLVSHSPRRRSTMPPGLWLFLPLLLFFSFILFQLLPLPPSLLHLLSPATYELYAKSLPGWPEKTPYGELSSKTPNEGGTDSQPAQPPWALLPTLEEERQGTPVPLNNRPASDSPSSTSTVTPNSSVGRWRPLSIAPSLTRSDLLKLLAYASLFFLVLLYPFGTSLQSEDENRFFRAVLLTILCAGLVVACIGLVQQFTWNGKILWFFVPYDWGAPRLEGTPQASGPFILHNHFANYLALIFPLALVGTLSPRFFVSREKRKAFRLFCGLIAFILLVGIILSLSRGGWTATALGVGALLWAFFSLPREKRPSLLRRFEKKSVVRFSMVGLVLLLVVVFYFVGSSGRGQVDVRLEETVMRETSLWDRVAVWQDSVGMIRDFALFGVGLGSWPELFPHYQRPPWSPIFYREAHNDYLELLAETGLVGFGLLAWFFWQGGRRLYQGLWTVSPRTVSVFAALGAALGIMAFHEFFDFNLQIPANAFLFTLLLGTAFRLARGGGKNQEEGVGISSFSWFPTLGPWPPLLAVNTGVVALLLLIFAFRQESLPYPYNLSEPTSLAEARESLFSHPARSSSHLSLFRFLQERVVSADLPKELEIALWLDPRNPSVRDLYATTLLQQGREADGLRELSQSVAFAPELSAHGYTNLQWLPWLPEKGRQAVEEGFKQALAAGYEGAVDELGAFYTALDRFAEAGRVYEEAALQEGERQLGYLLNAGLAYARAGDGEKAEALFRQATVVDPQNPRAYQHLATRVFAPKGDLSAAKAVIAAGIEKGADPLPLYLALGEAARIAKAGGEAKAALHQALALQPSSYEAHFRLGLLYLQERNFDRAALSLRKAADVDPSSASAFYYLGLAEEGRYQFFAAEKAYARAVTLAPNDASVQRYYEDFLRKVAEGGEGKG